MYRNKWKGVLAIKIKNIKQILCDTSYERVAGTENEHKCAHYLVEKCKELGFEAELEPFNIRMYKQEDARLIVDGKEIACTAFGGTKNGTVKGEICIFEGEDEISLEKCRGKIVLSYKPVGIKLYEKLCEAKALAFISFNGNVLYDGSDIFECGLANKVENKDKIPGVNIHLKDAAKLVRKKKPLQAELSVKQTEFVGTSYNVVVDIPGESQKYVLISAHYDSKQFSHGAYDNMSSCIGLLHILEYFKTHSHKTGIKLLFCGSEEIGLVGSRVYCRDHKDELSKIVLNINLDMLGCFMGRFTAFSCINEKTEEFLKTFAKDNNYPCETIYAIRSSDQNSFLVNNVKAVSFARYSVGDTAVIHTKYDTKKVIDEKQLLNDIDFVAKFSQFAANNPEFFDGMEISEKIKADAHASINKQRDLI